MSDGKKSGRSVVARRNAARGACAAPIAPFAPQYSPATLERLAAASTVMIVTDAHVRWSAPSIDGRDDRQGEMTDLLLGMVRSGQIGSDQASLTCAVLQIVSTDPEHWLTTGSAEVHETDIYQRGSGFFIREDGYLATAAHVVTIASQDAHDLLLSTLDRDNEQAKAAFGKGLAQGAGVQPTDDEVQKLWAWYRGKIHDSMKIESVTPTYRVSLRGGSAKAVAESGVAADLVGHGAPSPEKDVAILHVDGYFPALPLAATRPNTGVQLTAVGFPCVECPAQGVGTGEEPGTLTWTAGKAGPRAREQGWSAIGMSAKLVHGYSGGPVLDSSGRVVGIAAFMASPKGDTGASTGFAVPSELVSTFAKGKSAPATGSLTTQYDNGIQAATQGHLRDASQRFLAVQTHSDPNPALDAELANAKAGIAAGRDRPDLTWAYIATAVVGVLLIAAVAGLAGVLLMRGRRHRLRPA